MEECRFCAGKVIDRDLVGAGIKTVQTMLHSMFGMFDEEKTCCVDGIQLQQGNILTFDNSSGEYAAMAVEIKYCPMCGKELVHIEE